MTSQQMLDFSLLGRGDDTNIGTEEGATVGRGNSRKKTVEKGNEKSELH